MTEQDEIRQRSDDPADRRSSVRVHSRLPCIVEPVDREEIPALQAQILDMAVLESDGVMHDAVDWRDHTEDLSQGMVFVLNEIRALRQQMTEIQRVMEGYGQSAMAHQWVEVNDQGLWVAQEESEAQWSVGDFAAVRLQIPVLHTPEVQAVAQVIRVDEAAGREGVVFEFRVISQSHKRAISRYALRRERQKARSLRFQFDR